LSPDRIREEIERPFGALLMTRESTAELLECFPDHGIPQEGQESSEALPGFDLRPFGSTVDDDLARVRSTMATLLDLPD
jgi:hypothetical protein